MERLFGNKKKTIFLIACLAIALVVLSNACASMFFSIALVKKDGWKKFEKYSYGEELVAESQWISENSQKIEIQGTQGKALTALEIKNEHISHSYIVICHQYGGSPYSMEAYAKHFYDLGFNIILPFMRGHGESDYNNISFGWEDGNDVAAWTESVMKIDKNAKIALFGVSLGANAVTTAAAGDLDDNVRLVIADSCYTSLEELIEEFAKNETIYSRLLVSRLVTALINNKIGSDSDKTDTIINVRDIELPIMFINGENDMVVPALVSKRLYENCEADGVEEVIIENGAHGRNLEADEDAYWANIDAFILNNIGI